MAIPTAPTLSSLVTEALNKAGQSNPASALTTRAQDQWMEEIKNDIYIASVKVGGKLKSLFQTAILVTTENIHRYSLPSDYASDLTIVLLDGNTTGTLQTATASSATFASSDTSTEDDVVGRYILITAGTGKGSCSQASAYNTTTFIASVSPNFTTTPVTGDTYRIITEHTYLPPTDVLQLDMLRNITTKGKPTSYATHGDQDYGEFFFNFVPDDTYGIQLRYYVDLSLTDLTGTRISTLYRKWRNVWIQGIYAKAIADLDDDRAKKAEEIYYNYVNLLVEKETSGQDLGEMAFHIER